MGIGRGILEKETEQKLLSELPSLENELKDEHIASLISFKIVVFKTPVNLVEGIKIPTRMQFKFKFFTFKEEISPIVVPKEIGDDNKGQLVKDWQCATQYKLERINRSKDDLSEEEGWIFKQVYKVDPTLSMIRDENIELAKYMRE